MEALRHAVCVFERVMVAGGHDHPGLVFPKVARDARLALQTAAADRPRRLAEVYNELAIMRSVDLCKRGRLSAGHGQRSAAALLGVDYRRFMEVSKAARRSW